MCYSIEDLRGFGFAGFIPLKDWKESQAIGIDGSDFEGVYAVVRELTNVPIFFDDVYRKPQSKIWSSDEAAERWIARVQALYFGKGKAGAHDYFSAPAIIPFMKNFCRNR